MLEIIREAELSNVLKSIQRKQPYSNCIMARSKLTEFAALGGLYLAQKGETAVFICNQGRYCELYYFVDAEMNWPELPDDRPLLVNEPAIGEKDKFSPVGNMLVLHGFSLLANNLQMSINFMEKNNQIISGLNSGCQSVENMGITLRDRADDRQLGQIYELWRENLKKTDVPLNHFKLNEPGNGNLICAVDRGEKVCGALWWNHRGTNSEYRHIVVEKEFRHKGIASLLLYRWAKSSLDNGCRSGFTWVDQSNYSSLLLQKKVGLDYNGRHTYQFIFNCCN